MLIIACSVYYGNDTENFIHSFSEYSSKKPYIESYFSYGNFLYIILARISGLLGNTNFFLFKFIIFIFVIYLLVKGLECFSANFYLIIFLYLISAYFDDAIQLRNTLSVGFLIIGVRYLFDENDRLKAPLLILLATINHITFAFFFLLLIVRVRKPIVVSICFWSGLMLFLFIFFFHNFYIFEIAQSILKIEKYGSEVQTETHLGPLVPFFYYLYVLFVLFVMKKWSYNTTTLCNGIEIRRFISFVYDIYRIMAIPLFTCVITVSSWRFYRDIVLYFIAAVTMFYFCKNILRFKRLVVLCSSIFILYFYLWFGNFVMGPADEIIYAVYNGDPSWVLKLF